MKKVLLLVLIILMNLLSIYACDCFEILSHKKDFRKSSSVFIGEVIKIEMPNTEAREKLPDDLKDELSDLITFKIIKSWKGKKTEEIIWTHATHDLCSNWKFKVGGQYLVYVHKTEGIKIGAEFCSRTRPLETTDEKLIKEFKELDKF